VTVAPGQRIEYKIMEMDLDVGNPCPSYVQLSDVKGDGILCKPSAEGMTIMSTSIECDIIFQAKKKYDFLGLFLRNVDSGHRGFWLSYKGKTWLTVSTRNEPDYKTRFTNKVKAGFHYCNLKISTNQTARMCETRM
jgi:hypothetical protein